MKIKLMICMACSVFVFISGCKQTGTRSESEKISFPEQINFVIGNSKVGDIKLGMTINELNKEFDRFKCTKLIDLRSEGMFSPAIEIFLKTNDEASLIANVEFNKEYVVSSVTIKDDRFKTEKGIGIGSAFNDLKKAYKIDYVDWGEGNICAVVQRIGVTFCLDKTKIPEKWYNDRKNLSLIPEETKIIEIFMFK